MSSQLIAISVHLFSSTLFLQIVLLLALSMCINADTSAEDNIITVDSPLARRSSSYEASPYKAAVVGSSYSIGGGGGPLPPSGYVPPYHPPSDAHHSSSYPEPVGDIVKGRPASSYGETYFPAKKYTEPAGYEAPYKPTPASYYGSSSKLFAFERKLITAN